MDLRQLPKREQALKMAVVDFQPEMTIAEGCLSMWDRGVQLLQQDRFLQPDRRRQRGGEDQGLFSNEGRDCHGVHYSPSQA